MSALLATWVVLALAMLLMRRARWLHATASGTAATANLGPRLILTLAVIDEACRLAAEAALAQQPHVAVKLMHGARGGTAVLLRDMQRELDSWGASTRDFETADTGNLRSLGRLAVRSRAVRGLLYLERGLTLLLPGELARLRAHLFTLRLAWQALGLNARGLRVISTTWGSAYPSDVQLDLHTLAQATVAACAALARLRTASRQTI